MFVRGLKPATPNDPLLGESHIFKLQRKQLMNRVKFRVVVTCEPGAQGDVKSNVDLCFLS